MFHLILARCEYSARCAIDVFTHNSLRNKGDSLTAIAGHIEPSILGN